MMEPIQTSVAICPVCHQKIRPTAEYCPNCGAARHFGPTPVESAVCALAGLIMLPAISTLILPISLWTGVFAFAGLAAGFLFSHNRFGGDRWLRR